MSVRYLDHHQGLENLDVLILPGTKNTIADLLYLQRTGLAEKIKKYAEGGGRVIGICGGFQMLGQWVRDPLGVEGYEPEAAGTGAVTHCHYHGGREDHYPGGGEVFGAGKTPGRKWSGYEIHMGRTEPVGEGRAVFQIERRLNEPVGIADGWASPDFRIWGSYIHGLFDSDAFRQAWLADLRGKTVWQVDQEGIILLRNFRKSSLTGWQRWCGGVWMLGI